jgi:alanine dehydrogenase
MHLESGERRVFLPEFVGNLQDMGFEVFLETGYGESIGLSDQDYRNAANQTRFSEFDEIYQQDHVLVLRYPGNQVIEMMHPGARIISMLHFPTRPGRVTLLQSQELGAISLDTIKDDSGRRLVENLASVAWNGLKISFEELAEVYPEPGFASEKRKPIQVCLLGAGAVGKHVIQAAVAYGDPQLRGKLFKANVPGVKVIVIDYDLTGHPSDIQKTFSNTDILVDATQRPDASQPVIPNEWLGWLPKHAVITDLSVDPYTLDTDPPIVRGIEGIPQGSLDKYIFKTEDPEWDLTVPATIPSNERRTVVSCYSWPGIFPEACMEHYGNQLTPLMKRLVSKGYDGLSLDGDFFERALYRGTLGYFLHSQ